MNLPAINGNFLTASPSFVTFFNRYSSLLHLSRKELLKVSSKLVWRESKFDILILSDAVICPKRIKTS